MTVGLHLDLNENREMKQLPNFSLSARLGYSTVKPVVDASTAGGGIFLYIWFIFFCLYRKNNAFRKVLLI